MKAMKKLLGIMLAIAMAFTMTTAAYAEETKTYNYDIYQIFTGEFYDGILTNVAFGQNGTGDLAAALTELEALDAAATNQEKLAVITKYVDLTSSPFTTLNTKDNPATLEGLADGYYLVKDTDGSQDDESYTTFIVQVVDGTLTINRKADVPSVDKVILDPIELKENEASIGDVVNYEITGTLPTNIGDYNEYYYVFKDTLSKGLFYNQDVTVTVNGVDVTDYFNKVVSDYDQENGTTIIIGISDLLALENLDDPVVGPITTETEIVVEYSATLNENAVIADLGNKNTVTLEYSNNPNQSGDGTTTPPPPPPPGDEPETDKPTGETPPSTVVTYTTELTILKTDEKGNVLTGAEFTLTTEDGAKVLLVTEEKFTESAEGTYYKLLDGTYTTEEPTELTQEYYESTTVKYVKTIEIIKKGENTDYPELKGTVDENGLLTFTGLGVGTYTLTETVTPEGYNTIAPIEFTITFDYATKTFASNNADIVVGTDNKLDTTIVNEKGTVLPETGGMGTTLFYAVGAILVLGASVTLITKRRMSSK